MSLRRLVLGVSITGMVGAVLLVGGCGIATQQYGDDTAVGETIRSVRLATDSGTVRLRAGGASTGGSTGGSTTVHRQVHHLDAKPGATHRVEGDVLILAGCPIRNCWIDYDVVVPAGVTVSGRADSGDITVEGASSVNLRADSGDVVVRTVSGSVNVAADSGSVELADVLDSVSVEVSSGDIKVSNVRGAASLRTESGRIEAVGLHGPADLDASSGDITARLSAVANVRAHSDSGGITLSVPQGRYKVTADADSGDVDNAIGSDPAASNHLDVSATSGNLTIRYA
ncbi:DUF4097 family beta strand repeat-containing protein [Actinokineospora sp.]|uniref:DUF4097 family beta strand repeat-containing protein n=1 Tax=Actinokineospora sp. TaxID=1872133 RepID=UPI0040376A5D